MLFLAVPFISFAPCISPCCTSLELPFVLVGKFQLPFILGTLVLGDKWKYFPSSMHLWLCQDAIVCQEAIDYKEVNHDGLGNGTFPNYD